MHELVLSPEPTLQLLANVPFPRACFRGQRVTLGHNRLGTCRRRCSAAVPDEEL